jgi:hypothetical protein
MFGWCMYRAFHHCERFLWIHFENDQLYNVLENSGDRHDQLQYCRTANETFFSGNFASETNQNFPHFDILCVDGAFPDLEEKIWNLTRCYPNAAIIVCTEAWQPLDTYTIVRDHGDIYQYFMDSWKYDEYQSANSILSFGGLEPLCDELITERYYIAGGNCRNFKRGSYVAKQRIHQAMENEQYRRSSIPTEQLTAIFQKKRQVISKYAFERLAFDSSLHHVNLTLEITEDKQVFQGWLEEYDLKQTLKRFKEQLYDFRLYFRKEGLFRHLSAFDHYFEIKHVHEYELSGLIPRDTVGGGFINKAMYIPVKWTKSCFDMVYCHRVGNISHFYFLNCSIAKSRDFDFQYCATFMNTFFPMPHTADTRERIAAHFYVIRSKRGDDQEELSTFKFGNLKSFDSIQMFDAHFGEYGSFTASRHPTFVRFKPERTS